MPLIMKSFEVFVGPVPSLERKMLLYSIPHRCGSAVIVIACWKSSIILKVQLRLTMIACQKYVWRT
jgi:hypothetical protein